MFWIINVGTIQMLVILGLVFRAGKEHFLSQDIVAYFAGQTLSTELIYDLEKSSPYKRSPT